MKLSKLKIQTIQSKQHRDTIIKLLRLCKKNNEKQNIRLKASKDFAPYFWVSIDRNLQVLEEMWNFLDMIWNCSLTKN